MAIEMGDVLTNAREPNSKYIGFKPYMFLFRDTC
jgi:hypothetical protein